MLVEKLMDKERRCQFRILYLMQDHFGAYAIRDLTEELQLSKVTLLKYIDRLNTDFENEDFDIQIELKNEEALLINQNQMACQKIVKFFLKDSIPYQIIIRLFSEKQFSIYELSQELLVSEATLNRHLAHLNKLLTEFKIGISKGKQVGSELQWRYFYFELFQLTMTFSEKRQLRNEMNQSSFEEMIERLCGEKLSETKLSKLNLWFYICQKRLFFFNHRNRPQEKELLALDINVFYQRLIRALLHYFNRYAIEFDQSEVYALFAFLMSQSVLPIQTTQYILGFGGIIADNITESLWLIDQTHLVGDNHRELLIYGLSQFFCQFTFFEGIILSNYQFENSIKLVDNSKNKEIISITLSRLLHLAEKGHFQNNDTVKYQRCQLLELLLFSMAKSFKTVQIAIDFDDDIVAYFILEKKLESIIKNNRYIHFQMFSTEKKYDGIISFEKRDIYGHTPFIQVNKETSMQELVRIEMFVTELFEKLKVNQKQERQINYT